MLAALLCGLWLSSAYAAPIDPGDGTPGQQHALACVDQATTSFTANPASFTFGDPNGSTLTWSVRMPPTCSATLNKLLLNGVQVAFSGSQVVHPMSSGDFSLTMPIPTGTATVGSARVTVNLPTVVDIRDSTPSWRGVMFQALTEPVSPPRTVHLWPNVDMDLTGYTNLKVASGVTLVGGQPCPTPTSTQLCGGHDAQHPGPRLYTTSRPKALFELADNVHFSGFRLEGPHWNPADGDDNLEHGIYIENHTGIDISNMELAGWSGSAVKLTNESFPTQPRADAVRIHDNFFHHNQHIGGDGYGVDVNHGANVLIERNVFDFNRHAVSAGMPDTNTSYTAVHNLILKGGGYHGTLLETFTQIFDVHGDKNCLPSLLPDSLAGDSWWNCGHAGDRYYILNNAFQYTNGLSFKLRGTPARGAFLSNNVFPRSESDSVHQNETGMLLGQGAQANRFDTDTFGQYGVCDFDGDGKDDLFLATGVNWWYMSGARRQWVFLRPSDLRLDQVGLGDFDGDGRCDVLSVQTLNVGIYSGGTAEWHFLHVSGIPFDQLRFGHFGGTPRMDIFRRAPNGQWSLVSASGSTSLASSPLPLGQLHFGDFNGDHITDVVALVDGHWSVSWGGRSQWQALNPSMSDDLDSVLIADLDGDGADDILRYVRENPTRGRWDVSWAGRTEWQTLTSVDYPSSVTALEPYPAYTVRSFVGRFTDSPGLDLLMVDYTRLSRIYNPGTAALEPHGDYAY